MYDRSDPIFTEHLRPVEAPVDDDHLYVYYQTSSTESESDDSDVDDQSTDTEVEPGTDMDFWGSVEEQD